VIIEDGKLFYKLSGKLVHTPKDDKWIFVMSPSEKLYVAKVTFFLRNGCLMSAH
jgi:hypothetical protein